MSVKLTPKEQKQVISQRKNVRPTYYNANLGREVTISDDFESFLILTPKTTKRQAVTWISQSVSLRTRQLNRETLLREAIETERDVANSVASELALKTSAFNKFRDDLTAGKFAGVGEVGLMLSDLQAGLDAELLYEEKAKHLNKLLSVVESELNSLGLSADGIQQTQSWMSALLSY